MKKKITFWGLLGNWFVVTLILGLINMFLVKSSILHNLILVSLGIILLFYPVYPQNLESKWTPKKCRLFIRILAVIEIILSFATSTPFKNDNHLTVYSTTVVSTYSYRPGALLHLGVILAIIIAIIVGIVIWVKKRK